MKIMNPATGAVLAEVAADTLKTIRAKYELARAAQPKWAAVPIKKRLAVLQKFRSLLIDRQNLLAKTLTAEVGKPIRQSRNELNGLTGRIDFFLAETEKALRDEKVFADAKGAMEERIGHVPLGVIANISAWNYPYFVGGNVFVPALAAGNAVLYKPSEFATLTGQHIADLLHEAGVPRNVFVAIIGDGKTGAALLRQPVDGVFFTGSYRTGAAIAASTGRRMIKTQLELGGKDPIYVCEDVDVKAAAAGVADGAFYNTGQSCCSVERIYVHEKIYDEFVAAFVAEVKGFKIGDPQDEATYVGAITRKPQLGVLKAQVADAKRNGGKIAVGGEPLSRPGYFYPPTLVTDVGEGVRLVDEEQFGMALPIMKYAKVDDAIAQANATHYGLGGSIWTSDLDKGAALAQELESGTAWVNHHMDITPFAPFGGAKWSGIGHENGRWGYEAFTEMQVVNTKKT